MHRVLFVDAETYYDDEYSLKKMAPPNYILDPRFELIMCACAWDAEDGFIVDGPDFGSFLAGVDRANTTVVAFNALFDLCILAWRYRCVPARLLCSMRMAVALRGHLLQSASLAAVGRSLSVGVKGTEIERVRGLRRQDIIDRGMWPNFSQYALNDNDIQRGIFFKLLPEFPASERRIMDHVLRCAVEPEFLIDRDMLRQHLDELQTNKALALQAAGVSDVRELRSNPKFEALLKARGIDIEYKTTATGNTAPAFAKTDEFMETLQEHEDPVVQALAAARLGARSTIEQTRGERMFSIANCDWNCYRPGNLPLMPIPLLFSGGHTHRLSGTWKLNMQNLPAARGKSTSKLRKALIAPPGHSVVKADLSQIERRICAWITGDKAMLKLFADGGDPYCVLATKIFGRPITNTKKDEIERFIGKGGELGLGFRCGATKFFNMVIRQARAQQMDMAPLMAIWTEELAQRTVRTFRDEHWMTRNDWSRLDTMLATAWCGIGPPQQYGPVVIGEGYVALPSGLKMTYDVQCRDPSQDLTYKYGKRWHKMHGGVMLENIVQALARIIIMNAALRLWDRGFRFKLQEHDALAAVVPDAAVEQAKAVLKEELLRPPSWAPDLPLGADIGSGKSYGG